MRKWILIALLCIVTSALAQNNVWHYQLYKVEPVVFKQPVNPNASVVFTCYYGFYFQNEWVFKYSSNFEKCPKEVVISWEWPK